MHAEIEDDPEHPDRDSWITTLVGVYYMYAVWRVCILHYIHIHSIKCQQWYVCLAASGVSISRWRRAIVGRTPLQTRKRSRRLCLVSARHSLARMPDVSADQVLWSLMHENNDRRRKTEWYTAHARRWERIKQWGRGGPVFNSNCLGERHLAEYALGLIINKYLCTVYRLCFVCLC